MNALAEVAELLAKIANEHPKARRDAMQALALLQGERVALSCDEAEGEHDALQALLARLVTVHPDDLPASLRNLRTRWLREKSP